MTMTACISNNETRQKYPFAGEEALTKTGTNGCTAVIVSQTRLLNKLKLTMDMVTGASGG